MTACKGANLIGTGPRAGRLRNQGIRFAKVAREIADLTERRIR